jgi:hypothetical protein
MSGRTPDSPPENVTASLKDAALALNEIYLSLIAGGFNVTEALTIISMMMVSGKDNEAGKNDNDG